MRFRRLDGEAVLLDLKSGTYFGLSTVGARIWELLETGSTLDDVALRIAREFDASREVIDRDLRELVDRLASRGLVALET